MAAIADIQAALLVRSATITDALQRAECEAAIAEYIAIRTAILALSSSQVTSYSLAGRSVTRADLASLRQQAALSRAEITNALSNDMPMIADLSQTTVVWA